MRKSWRNERNCEKKYLRIFDVCVDARVEFANLLFLRKKREFCACVDAYVDACAKNAAIFAFL